MIAEDLAPGARLAEPQWGLHWGDKQRSARCKRPARALPAHNGRRQCVMSSYLVETKVLYGMTMPFCATS